MTFVFALIFCILNALQGVFIFFVSFGFKQLLLKETKKNTKTKYYVDDQTTNSTSVEVSCENYRHRND